MTIDGRLAHQTNAGRGIRRGLGQKARRVELRQRLFARDTDQVHPQIQRRWLLQTLGQAQQVFRRVLGT